MLGLLQEITLQLTRVRKLVPKLRALQARWRTTVVDGALRYKPGQQLSGYTVNKVVPVPEMYLTAVLVSHDQTGAQHLHVARDDSNNVFGVAFRTTPRDSTGVPHILEHTSLCGSHKYPVRDPFFKMLTRSLSTFMNAFTASDWTMYPFSTQNEQDYENLLSVYLDAVFQPRLTELDFRQEGWRLEHDNVQDPNSPVVFKGVVYNEMKGVYSNSQHLFSEKAQNCILPSHTYAVCYGGDPMHILDLTWDQLKDFHASHYHPSNARFYTYGDFSLERHLELINETSLSRYSQASLDTTVPLEPRWQSPREVEITCSPDPMAADPTKQTTVAVSYLLKDITDIAEAYSLSILGNLLVEGEQSPFYQSLVEANIGSDYAPVNGYCGNTRESTFSVGLEGIHEDDVSKVTQIIEDTIDKVIKEGFPAERIEALLHKIELSQKHQTEKFGLYLGIGLLPSWNHGGDPEELLQVNKQVERFKTCIKENPKYLQDLVKHYFKDNRHKLTLVMRPDENAESKRQDEENQKLADMMQNLTEGDKEGIYQKGLELVETQMAEEDLSCLPTLKISDIEPNAARVHTEIIQMEKVPIQLSVQPTNDVTYFRAVSDLSKLPMESQPYIPLFCNIVTKMGAGVLDYKQLSQKIDLKTGGLFAHAHVDDHHTEGNLMEQGVLFSSYCLGRNVEAMFDLWVEIFHRLDLTNLEHLKTLVRISAAELAHSLSDAGHVYAMTHAAGSMTPAGHLREAMSGMSVVSLMKRVAETDDYTQIVDHLREIARFVLTRENFRCSMNATPECLVSASRVLENFVKGLHHSKETKPEKLRSPKFYFTDKYFHPQEKLTHFELPFQVNYMARSVQTVPFIHPDFASLRVLGKLLTTRFLHREIREKGGAYGGGATGSTPGIFSFFSYRDPNSMHTLDVFDEAVEWSLEGKYNQQDIDEAKLSVFAQVDLPIPPGDRGQRLFLHGIDDDMNEKHREQLFAVTKDDLVNVTKQYLQKENRLSSVSFLGPENSGTSSSDEWKIMREN